MEEASSKMLLILSALWTHLIVKRFHLIGVIMNYNDTVRVALRNVAGQELRLRWWRSCVITRHLFLIQPNDLVLTAEENWRNKHSCVNNNNNTQRLLFENCLKISGFSISDCLSFWILSELVEGVTNL